jgi:hypothetical protein
LSLLSVSSQEVLYLWSSVVHSSVHIYLHYGTEVHIKYFSASCPVLSFWLYDYCHVLLYVLLLLKCGRSDMSDDFLIRTTFLYMFPVTSGTLNACFL